MKPTHLRMNPTHLRMMERLLRGRSTARQSAVVLCLRPNPV
jgi:hypothetical protein